MKHDEFIGQVQHYAGLSSRGEAERATRVVLETLGERLAGGEPKDLASQLPSTIGEYLVSGLAGMGEPFSLDEFFLRVGVREGVDYTQAVIHARAVIKVLCEAVSMGEVKDVLSQLPSEYDLFVTDALAWTMQE